MKITCKRGQEEIVGFVLIMVVVAVIFLIFLGISLRQDIGSVRSESSEVYQFLESSMEFTTDCAYSESPDYYRLGELFEECYSGNKCINGGNACEVLDMTIRDIIDSSWTIGPEATVNGYEFVSYYRASSASSADSRDTIIELKKGECTGNKRGATYITPAFPGIIESELILCFRP